MHRLSLPNAEFVFLNQGAIVNQIKIAGQDVVLSLAEPAQYLEAPYFGETIGRVANRIRDGKIQNLNGRAYQLTTNEKDINHHHGGTHGWGHKQFAGPTSVIRNGRESLQFIHVSPDGDEGYPGTVELQVYYTAYETKEEGILKSVLDIEYEARLISDECDETVVNVTNHSYFHIGNGPTIEGTELTLATDQHLQVDANGIPTGQIGPFVDIEPDKSLILGAKEPSIDHCFVMDVNDDHSIDTRGHAARRMVQAHHPSTHLHLDVYSTEPSFQLYTGDFNNVAASAETPARGPRSGFCVEPGRFIDAINVPEWRSQVVLARGQMYGSRILYKLWKD